MDVPLAIWTPIMNLLKPRIGEARDVILINCYPFWKGCDMNYALLYIKDMFQRVLRTANGKKVISLKGAGPTRAPTWKGYRRTILKPFTSLPLMNPGK
jgi:hypothetical protein